MDKLGYYRALPRIDLEEKLFPDEKKYNYMMLNYLEKKLDPDTLDGTLSAVLKKHTG